MSISSYSSDSSAASQSHSQDFIRSTPSRQSDMVQPDVQERYSRPGTPPVRLSSLYSVHVFNLNLRFDSGLRPTAPAPTRRKRA
eukprot:scaffold5668_cov111-Isochrysis_galbana.AAC.19